MLGTMRVHRRKIPLEAKLGKGATLYSSAFLFTPPEENIMLLSYKAKKNEVVYLLSSSHKTTTVYYGEQKKPQAILDYNATKGGEDTADEMLRTHSKKAASRRWLLAAFFNLVDITALDTNIICADISISTCSRRNFLIKLGESLCSAERSRQQKAQYILRLKRIRQGEDEDLPPSKQTKMSDVPIHQNESQVCQLLTFCLWGMLCSSLSHLLKCKGF